MLEMTFETLEETPLPPKIREKLTEAGFDTPSKVLKATDEELLAIKGIGRQMLAAIREEVRTPLDRALDGFRPVAKEYFESLRTFYPANSKVLDMQGHVLRVKDFLALWVALEGLD